MTTKEIPFYTTYPHNNQEHKHKFLFQKNLFLDGVSRVDLYQNTTTSELVVWKSYQYDANDWPHDKRAAYHSKRLTEVDAVFNHLGDCHPNICKGLGWYQQGTGNPCDPFSFQFIFPFIQDSSKSTHVSLTYIQSWVSTMIRALAHIHSKKIIYSNFKHDNVLYNKEKETFVLIDFGDVRFNDEVYPYPEGGSGLYKAPEQRTGKYGYPADMYSVGIALMLLCDGIQQEYKIKNAARDAFWAKLLVRTEAEKSTFWETSLGVKHSCLWSDEVVDLIFQLTHFDATKRFTADQALNHPFFETK